MAATAVQQRHSLTLSETAERMRVSERTVRRLVARRELPAYRFGTPDPRRRNGTGSLDRWACEELVDGMSRRLEPGMVVSETDDFWELKILRKFWDDEAVSEEEIAFLERLSERRQLPHPRTGTSSR